MPATKDSHTPTKLLPLHIHAGTIRGDNGDMLATAHTKEFAELIVRAVNSHAALVALLTEFAAEDSQCDIPYFNDLKSRARSALASAKL